MRPVFPCRVSQPFADPGTYNSRADSHGPPGHHTGIDYGSFPGTTIEGKVVRSILPGEVLLSTHDPDIFGHWVGVYNHKHDLFVTYWHMSKRHVQVGSWVLAWHSLGLVGETGNTDGAHLHMQVNHGKGFDYHGHLNPAVALSISPTRLRARQQFRALGGIHPEVSGG